MRIINFTKNHQYLIGIVAIIISFVVVRLPYFMYIPIPFINGDAFEYNRVINLLESGSNTQIGFPGIGYPLLILLCEKINDTSVFFFFVQSVLQLLAVLLFYHFYKVYLKKYLFYVAVILIGYLTSNINLYYDTAYHPDSLMGSLFIISLALFLRLIYNPSFLYFTLLSFVVVYSISVRANGIVLIPLILAYLTYILITFKSFIKFFQMIGIFLIPILILCTFHFFSPIYKTFNIVSYPSTSNLETIYTGAKLETTESEIWKKIEKLPLKKYLYTSYLSNKSVLFKDSLYAAYIMSQQRGYLIYQNKFENIIIENYNDTRSVWASINLDSVLIKKDKKELFKYSKIKNYYSKFYKNKKILISSTLDFKHRWMHFIGFYKLFYLSIELPGTTLGKENLFFYKNNIQMRYGNCFSDLKNHSNKKNVNRVYKELSKLNKPKIIDVYKLMMKDYWSLKVSRLYRFFISPFYKIQPFLFRNFIIPIIFNIVLISSIIGIFYTRFSSKIYVFSILTGLLLIMTNALFSFYFCYSYTRYTYQVSFVYYLSLIILPLLIQDFRKGKTTIN